ncbi:MAG: glucoamylase family protein [Ferruginibacter sp.]
MSFLWLGCKKDNSDQNPPVTPPGFSVSSATIDGAAFLNLKYDCSFNPVIKFYFSTKIDAATVSPALNFRNFQGALISYQSTMSNGDSAINIIPNLSLQALTKYSLSVNTTLKSQAGGKLLSALTINFVSKIDSSDKFPLITEDALLTKVQEQTFKYFWDFGHPASGLARERNTSGDVTTSGGSGFGIMAIPVGINRSFITRNEGLQRMQTIVAFLKNTAQTFHGAYPHWINGNTGAAVPFSPNDNGADLVETSYLVMGLLCARQYFSEVNTNEITLRDDINIIVNRVEWDWFRRGGQNVLYWHWSPTVYWAMNLPIKGWNECLITYILAASSATHGIPLIVYNQGWKGGSGYLNGNTYYGYTLPLGPNFGGPLFFSHYSFLGVNPFGLQDGSISFETQTKNHARINYNYCKANPLSNYGYSQLCWGLTASDIQNGYTASSPTNDVGVIAPTAAISSIAYTPAESMQALKFYYYKLGDKLWGQYGFVDAFSLKNQWFASSYLAIDQGPMIVMIENYRTGLLWNLFTSCPEIKSGMLTLGFTAPYL